MERTRQRWRDTYMLRKTDRAPVWLRLDPACLPELLPDESLQCENPFLRSVEKTLRIALRQHEFGDDTIALPYWKIPAAIQFEGDHLWENSRRNKASFTLSGVKGMCRKRTPIASYTALAMAAETGPMAPSPTPM